MSRKANETGVFLIRPLRLSVSQWAIELGRDKSTVSRWLKRAGIKPRKHGVTLHAMLQALNYEPYERWDGFQRLSALDWLLNP